MSRPRLGWRWAVRARRVEKQITSCSSIITAVEITILYIWYIMICILVFHVLYEFVEIWWDLGVFLVYRMSPPLAAICSNTSRWSPNKAPPFHRAWQRIGTFSGGYLFCCRDLQMICIVNTLWRREIRFGLWRDCCFRLNTWSTACTTVWCLGKKHNFLMSLVAQLPAANRGSWLQLPWASFPLCLGWYAAYDMADHWSPMSFGP